MNTTRNAIFIAFLAAASTAAAFLPDGFRSWDDLTQNSPDIVIARCTATPDPFDGADGMVWSDIEVLSVLKGDTKPGVARMVSQYCPHQGERFLMFSTYESNKIYRAYNAAEAFRVVPFAHSWVTYDPTGKPPADPDDLTGKPLAEQIRIVLRRRLEDVNRDLARATEEKKRLEGGLTK
jgi:hypothetical protein